MAEEAGAAPNRLERRKARTRASLVRAAQGFIAAGRTNVPILEITQAADVGMGSFYNHFDTKEELFDAAVEDALDAFGAAMDQLTADIDDPAAGLRAELPAHRPAAPPPARPEQGAAAQRPGATGSDKGWPPAPAATSKPRTRRAVHRSRPRSRPGHRGGRRAVPGPATARPPGAR